VNRGRAKLLQGDEAMALGAKLAREYKTRRTAELPPELGSEDL
jgi:hypothetical protein